MLTKLIKEDTFSDGIAAVDLINYSQAELRKSAPPVGQIRSVSNIQVHGQIVNIVSFGKNQYSPAMENISSHNVSQQEEKKNALHDINCKNHIEEAITIYTLQQQIHQSNASWCSA